MTKRCSKCRQDKNPDDFHKNRSTKDGLQDRCKVCIRSSQLEIYHNSEKRQLQYKQIHNKRKEANRDWFWNYLQTHPCVECGESNPLILEIDHVNPLKNARAKRIATMVNSGFSTKTIEKAIIDQGCQVLCPNCHTLKTVIESASWRWIKYYATNI